MLLGIVAIAASSHPSSSPHSINEMVKAVVLGAAGKRHFLRDLA